VNVKKICKEQVTKDRKGLKFLAYLKAIFHNFPRMMEENHEINKVKIARIANQMSRRSVGN